MFEINVCEKKILFAALKKTILLSIFRQNDKLKEVNIEVGEGGGFPGETSPQGVV